MMLLHFLLLAASAAAAAVAEAKADIQSVLAKLPACSLSCGSIIIDGGCSLDQTLPSCYCTNNTMQYNVGSCMLNACNTTEVYAASALFQTEVCEGQPKESRSHEIIIATTAFASITCILVIGRLIARRMVTTTISWDDRACIASAILAIPTTTILIFNATRGWGSHFWDVPPENITLLRKLYYSAQILYVLNLASSKISILLLYRRVFNNPRFRLCVHILLATLFFQHIGFTLAVVFICTPIRRTWEPSVPGHCSNTQAMIYSGAALSIVEDFVVMFLPMNELKKLKLNTKKKVGLGIIFATGSLASITGVIRLKYLLSFGNTLDSTWNNVDVVLWSTIEVYTSLICACLVCLRPLVVYLIPCLKSLNSTAASRSTSEENRRIRERISAKFRGENNGIRLSKPDLKPVIYDTDNSALPIRLETKGDMYAANTELGQMGYDTDVESGHTLDDCTRDTARPFDASQAKT